MAKALKTAGIVLGAAALIATGVGAVGGLGIIAAATATTVGTIAGIAATAANIGAQSLQKPPPARGSVAQAVFDPNAPSPYVMGEGYVGPVERYKVGYGGIVDKVKNPYLAIVDVFSVAGPVESLTPYVDFAAVSGYYSGFLYTDTQLGATPEADALAPHFGGMPDWGSAYKLSGEPAILWNAKFDKKGEKFASGFPTRGAYGQWVKVYDPRLDSTFPGGSGACRLGDESTYVWSERPALHAGTYAYGRYANGARVMGVGLPVEGIDFATIAAWANVCEANGWTIFGRVFEGAADEDGRVRWANLADICAAGGGRPIFAGGVLSFHYSAPAVALATVTAADNAGGDDQVTAQQSYRDRVNTGVFLYTSADHNWEQVQAAPVTVASLVTEDGEVRRQRWPLNLVKDADQGAQLVRYKIEDSRELHPIQLHLLPEWRWVRPGDCLHIDRPDLGLDTDAIVLTRQIDPADWTVTLTLQGETSAKHAFALGQTGTPPATPALTQTGEDADSVSYTNTLPPGYVTTKIATSYTTDADPADGLLQADAPAGVVSITIEGHTRTYADFDAPVPIDGATLTEDENADPLATETLYHIAYDDGDRVGGAVAYVAYLDPVDAATSGTNPDRHYVGSIMTPAADATSQSGGSPPSGWSGPSWWKIGDSPP